jgi:hypothetical protein
MGRYLELAADVIAELDTGIQCEKSELCELSPAAAPTSRSRPGERVVLLHVPRGVPSEWGEGVLALLTAPAPAPFNADRWRTIQDDAVRFLQARGAEACRLGWTGRDLFGVHRHAPLVRYDCMGLVPLLDGCQVAALTEDGAVLVTRSGARQTFRRHQAIVVAELCMIWDLGGDGPETLGDVA